MAETMDLEAPVHALETTPKKIKGDHELPPLLKIGHSKSSDGVARPKRHLLFKEHLDLRGEIGQACRERTTKRLVKKGGVVMQKKDVFLCTQAGLYALTAAIMRKAACVTTSRGCVVVTPSDLAKGIEHTVGRKPYICKLIDKKKHRDGHVFVRAPKRYREVRKRKKEEEPEEKL